jgi:hypothetical protein
LKGLNSGLFVNIGQYPCSYDPDPEPGEPDQCGSGYETLTEFGGNCNATVHTQLFQVSKASKNKSKSAHDLAKDPSLASDVGGLTQVCRF